MHNKIKVLHIINGEFFAGAERVQDLLGLNLPRLGIDMAFVSIKPRDFKHSRESVDIPLYEIEMKSRFDFRVALQINKIVKEGNYRIIHTHTPRSALIGWFVSILSGLPMVHHIHSPTEDDTEDYFRNKINAVINRMSLSRVTKFIAVSKSMKQYILTKGYKNSDVTVVHNGVPISEKSYELEHIQWLISCVAYFRPRKGLEVLIKALAEVNRQYSVKLRIIGAFETPEHQQKIKHLVNELKLVEQIEWSGFSHDVLGELSKTNLFVLPSLYGEGLPMVILEAMSIGLPIVSTAIEGIPEVIKNGQQGYLVKPDDSSALAQAIINIIKDPEQWKIMSDNSKKRHHEYFSDIAMSKNIASIYSEILNKMNKKTNYACK